MVLEPVLFMGCWSGFSDEVSDGIPALGVAPSLLLPASQRVWSEGAGDQIRNAGRDPLAFQIGQYHRVVAKLDQHLAAGAAR